MGEAADTLALFAINMAAAAAVAIQSAKRKKCCMLCGASLICMCSLRI